LARLRFQFRYHEIFHHQNIKTAFVKSGQRVLGRTHNGFSF